ncbi:lytic murein transglycosylase B [Aliiglaciecola sp. 3_MG-2023]|uniref:lytic murein transglycosylase B n=1 Tax=Aliiglaciecola sp. 3_MG-2023 TaxID=3062644 RepID=UPI0026E3D8F6|nr:lytic murein transglycosylase B [Aliiglaciecola sp. 3_MG-2023]MDO6692410.1 lytic murein transglycosylase B [Aliiglaciecola sp. 3_MG-2023]
MRVLAKFLFFSALSLNVSKVTAETANTSQIDAQIEEFVVMMAEKHQFNPDVIKQTLDSAHKNQTILDAIARPWEAKPWHQYFPIFLTEKRLAKGIEFWQQHKEDLQRAEQETGVPAQIIVAIIGVETFYGTYKGKYSVLDALYTLGFYYPPRATFFRSELAEYFLLTREEGFNLQDVKGSYAGAMGWGQFISSSYRHYAVDFDGDGVRDLLNNPTDAIGSVANYFKRHGWKPNEPVAYKANVLTSDSNIDDLLSKSLKYTHTWQDLEVAGVSLNENITLSPQQSVKLLAFQQPENSEYWVGLPNFYTITRYNHSPLYAMAVFQFSQQLKQAME